MTDDLKHDFRWLVGKDYETLLTELAATHTSIANLHVEIAFLKTQESNRVEHAKAQRLDYEAERDALNEKKWLILQLLQHRD